MIHFLIFHFNPIFIVAGLKLRSKISFYFLIVFVENTVENGIISNSENNDVMILGVWVTGDT